MEGYLSCKCDFGNGLKTCHCTACHESFASVSAFDLHQRLDTGHTVCADPAAMRRKNGNSVLVSRDGIWGQYDPRGARPRLSQNCPGKALEHENNAVLAVRHSPGTPLALATFNFAPGASNA